MGARENYRRDLAAIDRRHDRRERRRFAQVAEPMKRHPEGGWQTLDGIYVVVWHPGHRQWFITDADANAINWDWHDTLWEAREEILRLRA